MNAATVMVKLVKGRRAVRRAFGSDTSSSISPGKRFSFFSIISVRSSQCLCCRGVKQPWHETTDFPLLGKDQKPNVSQTLLLLTLKRYKLGELLHGPSFWSLERFLWDLEKADAKKPSKTDQGHCGGNLGEGIVSQVSLHIVTFHTHFFVPTKTFLEIFNNKMT